MDAAESFLDAPDDTQEEIMRATYLALCEHGYANLTIERISDSFPKSTSLIYNHYDGKDELLLAFLEFVLEQFAGTLPGKASNGPDEQLRAMLDHVLASPLPEQRREFAKAMVELRAQAAHDQRYREHFTRSDRFFRDRIADSIEAGIEAGVFDDVDSDETAAFLVTLINGAMTQRVTSDDEAAPTIRTQVDTYLEAALSADHPEDSEVDG